MSIQSLWIVSDADLHDSAGGATIVGRSRKTTGPARGYPWEPGVKCPVASGSDGTRASTTIPCATQSPSTQEACNGRGTVRSDTSYVSLLVGDRRESRAISLVQTRCAQVICWTGVAAAGDASAERLRRNSPTRRFSHWPSGPHRGKRGFGGVGGKKKR
jgi:hypothetical protein